MKAFLHKFVGLERSEQWTEVEQHDSSALLWRAWPVSITLCCWRLTPGFAFFEI